MLGWKKTPKNKSQQQQQKEEKILRLVAPRWQAANRAPHYYGSYLLNFLAGPSSDPTEFVPTPSPTSDEGKQGLKSEKGITARTAVMAQTQASASLIAAHTPDRIVTFGGDCGVSVAPFGYLLNRYKGEKIGLLYLDAHPDVSTVKESNRISNHVIANLMGIGEAELTALVPSPVSGSRVLIAGLQPGLLPFQKKFLKDNKITTVGPEAVKEKKGEAIAAWVREQGITHLVIHIDLDVLDPKTFASTLFGNPALPENLRAVARGAVQLQELADMMRTVEQAAKVVGITYAEFFPWDAIRLSEVMRSGPILKQSKI